MSSLEEQTVKRTTVESMKGRAQRALKLSEIFEGASRATCDATLEAAEVSVVPGGTVLIEQGTPPGALLLIGRGRARVERKDDRGRVVPLGYRGSGEVLSEACFGSANAHTESVIAMEEVEVVRIPLALVREAMANDPALAAAVFDLLLARKRETEERIESLLFHNVERRVIEFLLKSAERWGVPTPKGALISAPITHLEIARAIGSTRETVTLTLGALRRDGMLDVAGRRLIVKDRDGLLKRIAA